MAVKVELDYKNSFICPIPVEKSFEFFASFEKTIPPHFPGLEDFVHLEDSTYLWKFDEIRYSGYSFQLEFRTKLVPQPTEIIEIIPVSGSNGNCEGHWKFSSVDESQSEVEFAAKLSTELPVPFFLKSVVVPLSQKEIGKYFDRYITNVDKVLKA